MNRYKLDLIIYSIIQLEIMILILLKIIQRDLPSTLLLTVIWSLCLYAVMLTLQRMKRKREDNKKPLGVLYER